LHFIKDNKDAWDAKLVAGGFFYQFLSEANAVARAQVAALGGNALLYHRVVPQEVMMTILIIMI
jgi:hypothetical protein